LGFEIFSQQIKMFHQQFKMLTKTQKNVENCNQQTKMLDQSFKNAVGQGSGRRIVVLVAFVGKVKAKPPPPPCEILYRSGYSYMHKQSLL
jgi:hypothetical protein